jgi:hypothetical protein
MAMGHDSIMVGKSYRTPGDEVRTVRGIDNDEVVYRAACGASPTMIARTEDRKCPVRNLPPRSKPKFPLACRFVSGSGRANPDGLKRERATAY